MTYTVISVIGTDIYVVEDRIVNQWRLQCCRMVITTCQRAVRRFLPTWRHHHPMIASTIVAIIQWQMSMILSGENQHGKAHPRLDASLRQCTLRSEGDQDLGPAIRLCSDPS